MKISLHQAGRIDVRLLRQISSRKCSAGDRRIGEEVEGAEEAEEAEGAEEVEEEALMEEAPPTGLLMKLPISQEKANDGFDKLEQTYRAHRRF